LQSDYNSIVPKLKFSIFLSCLLVGCAHYTYKSFGQGRNLHARLENGQTFLVMETTNNYNCDRQATAMDRRWFDYGGGSGNSIVCTDQPPPAYMKSSVVISTPEGILALHMPSVEICRSVFEQLSPGPGSSILEPCGPFKPLEEEL